MFSLAIIKSCDTYACFNCYFTMRVSLSVDSHISILDNASFASLKSSLKLLFCIDRVVQFMFDPPYITY